MGFYFFACLVWQINKEECIKLGIVKRIQKQINKFALTDEDLNIVNIRFFNR